MAEAVDGYDVHICAEDFVTRFRDISFNRETDVLPTIENIQQILKDSGLDDYLLSDDKICLRSWQEPYLLELTDAIQDQRINSNSHLTDEVDLDDGETEIGQFSDSLSVTVSGLEDLAETTTISGHNEELDVFMTDTLYETPVRSSNWTLNRKDENHYSMATIPECYEHEVYLPETHARATMHTSGLELGSISGNSVYEEMQSGRNTKNSEIHGIENRNSKSETADSNRMVSEWMEQHVADCVSAGPNMHQNTNYARKLLDPRWWDRFQMMPRENLPNNTTFHNVFKVFKVVCYIFLMMVVLGSAVVNKICILIMTSSVTKDSLQESRWPAKTMLLISMCFPYSIWFLVYTGKSLFGSTTWPSLTLLASMLFLEVLHTFGLSLLVFRVLPLFDMMRCFIVLGSIYVVPAFLKTIFEGRDPNTGCARKCSIFILNFGAFLIQISSLVLCEMFNVALTSRQKYNIRSNVLSAKDVIVVPRPPLTPDYFNGDTMYELPVAIFLISISYWENYVEGEFKIFGWTMNFKAWKKHLHHARERVYIFASVWKIAWAVGFAILLQNGFNFNLVYTPANIIGQQTTLMPSVASLQDDMTPAQSFILQKRDVVHLQGSDLASTPSVISTVPTVIPNLQTTILINPNVNINNTQKTERNLTEGLEQSLFYLSAETMQHFGEYGVMYIQIFSSLFLTYFGSTACKLCMQILGFSLPLVLATPVSVAVVVLQCIFEFLPTGRFVWIGVETGSNLWILHLAWLGVLWLSEIYITSHIWFPGNGRMEKIDSLFVIPIRCGILADQSLMLRRRRHDQDASLTPDVDEDSFDQEDEQYKADDVVPQIYACATMWHETRPEMTNLLKSIFRMDIDHSARYLAQKFYNIRDPDYYEFEAHIFFDDAMELSDEDELVPNMFVADLMECIDDSLSCVHERQMSLGPPTRTPTPYGGKLTWKLPGGTKLVTHLKDKHKIRHKKRWSQVMYMYYLLGYRILAQPENILAKEGLNTDESYQRVKLTESQLRRRRKAAHFTRSVIFNYVTDEVHTQAENTYILTLDGDVDFRPDAVRLLVDRLKTNKKVGAACGRIHPIGSGPLLWYQQFEYAIGHWLQKATEHVFGCVMCAPGCFSLFRGSALMDDNVARTYATRATEAGHYVQYDQGEDRWLSTLLLQQGYRIDYCAASDALTHAPETFSEFFNQRRRWGPSTLANIVDLLGGWRTTIRINDNISTLYIVYQFCLMLSTVLGPATVLLMLAGAFVIVFKMTVIQSYLAALVPAVFFIIICIYTKPNTQVTIASIMSAIYAVLMTVVFVGTIGQAIESGLTSPNVIFLVLLVLIFFISALMHPEEFFCVIPGALYFICLPNGYLLLTIYYLCNMNVVSWGTREVPQRKSKEDLEIEKREAEEQRKKKDEKKKGILGLMGLSTFFKDVGEVLKQIRADISHVEKSKTDVLLEELIIELRSGRVQNTNTTGTEVGVEMDGNEIQKLLDDTKGAPVTQEQDPVEQRQNCLSEAKDDSMPVLLHHENPENPGWLKSQICGNGPIKKLPEKENLFWKQIIAKYLNPINEDKVHQEKVKADLVNLRNNVVFGFFMTSALWIALTLQLQILQEELKDSLFFKIPRLEISKHLTFEPLGLIFLAFFAFILCVQFLGMFVHRWGTLLHMLSITDISCSKTFTEQDKVREIILKSMELQKLSNIENEPIPDYDEPIPDYAETDDDDIFDALTSFSGESVSVWSNNPPSYQTTIPTDNQTKHQREIFNTRGNASGVALRRAFEKRFRNENQGLSKIDTDLNQQISRPFIHENYSADV